MKKRQKRRVVVRERKLGRGHAVGWAYFDENRIEVDPRQRARRYLNTLIHETLHLLYPESAESRVKRDACTLTRVVWEARFRRLSK